jgi:beta-galactosidase
LAYDVFNEVCIHSTDPHAEREFREWARKKYSNDIKKLNYVWGRFYTDFDQILVSNLDSSYGEWSSLRPRLDFEEFRADSIVWLIQHWSAIIRDLDKKHFIIADNEWSMSLFDTMENGNDDWKVPAVVDVFGLSIYPQSWNIRLRQDPCRISQTFTGGVCAGAHANNRAVMVSELQTHNQMALSHDSSVFEEIKLWTWQAFSYGCQGLVYWKWNPFTRGKQVAARGMTAQDGTPNDRAAQAAQCAAVLKKHPDLFIGRRVYDNGVALVYSPESDRITDLTTKEEQGLYRRSFEGWYRYFWNRGITPAIIQTGDLDNENYKHLRLAVIPCLIMLSKNETESLGGFIKRGGKAVADGRFAIVDENGFAYEKAPGNLTDLFGYVERDFYSPYTDGEIPSDRFSLIQVNGGEAALKSAQGHAAAVTTKNTPYLAVPFGHDIDKRQYADILNRFVESVIDKSAEVLPRSPLVDVVLSRGKGLLISAANYDYHDQLVRVRIRDKGDITDLWQNQKPSVEETDQDRILEFTVRARDVAGYMIR